MDTIIKNPIVQHIITLLLVALGIWLMLVYFTNILSYGFVDIVLILISIRAAKYYVMDVP